MEENGKFLGLKVETTANMGAYLSSFATAVPTYLYATLLAGQYTTPVIFANVKAVFTNTAPVDAYRGAGRPAATYVLERIVEVAACEMKIDPVALRRRNFIQPDQFPYQRLDEHTSELMSLMSISYSVLRLTKKYLLNNN